MTFNSCEHSRWYKVCAADLSRYMLYPEVFFGSTKADAWSGNLKPEIKHVGNVVQHYIVIQLLHQGNWTKCSFLWDSVNFPCDIIPCGYSGPPPMHIHPSHGQPPPMDSYSCEYPSLFPGILIFMLNISKLLFGNFSNILLISQQICFCNFIFVIDSYCLAWSSLYTYDCTT